LAKFWIRVVILAPLLAANIVLFKMIDGELETACTHKSQQLEFVADSWVAGQIVADWYRHAVVHGVAAGIVADVPFILIYVLLLGVIVNQCAIALPQVPRWPAVAPPLVRAIVVAGIFDLVENAGMLLELYARWFVLAPFVSLMALAKWIILGVAGLYVLLSIGLWVRILAARGDEQLLLEVSDF